jgi:hypothetical protein
LSSSFHKKFYNEFVIEEEIIPLAGQFSGRAPAQQRLIIFFHPEAAAANYLFRSGFFRKSCVNLKSSSTKRKPRISAGAFS